MNLFENLQLIKEADNNNILSVKIQRGTNNATGGQGYYNIFPERNKSHLTKDLWDKLEISKIDVTHFPSEKEAEEYITDFAEENNISIKIESNNVLNEVISESDFINPSRLRIHFDKPLSDEEMQKLYNLSLNIEVLITVDNDDYQICLPGKEDWINKIKKTFSNVNIND